MRNSFPKSREILAAACVVTALGLSCGKSDNSNSSQRTNVDDSLAGEVAAEVKSDAGGVVTAVIKAGVVDFQKAQASAQSRIAGTSVRFAPGSYDIDFEVTIEE